MHDVDGLLPGRRARAPGAGAQPAAGAVLRAGGDRGRRLAGDQRRARVGRPQARRRVLHGRRGRGDPRLRASARPAWSFDGRLERRRRRRGQRARRARRPCCGCCATTRSPTACATGSRTSTTTAASCWWANLALHEPPDYGRRRRPAAAAVLGPEGPGLLRHAATSPRSTSTGSRRGRSRCPASTRCGIRRRAPEGKHLVGVEEFAAPRRLFSDWAALKERFTDHLLDEWRRYAPNMTRDNVIALRVYGPDDIERKRPDMLEGGYSSGSTIASQLGRFRPDPGAVGLPDAARQPLQLLGQHALRLRASGAGPRTTASTRSPPTSGWSASSRSPDEGARHRRGARPRPRVRRGAGTRAATTCSASTSPMGCDVTREADCEAAVAEAVRRFGGLDGLVNNAGIVAVTRAPGARDPADEWDRVMDGQRQGHVADDPRRDRRRWPTAARSSTSRPRPPTRARAT